MAAVLAVGGCGQGFADLSDAEVQAEVEKAMRSVESLRMSGRITSGGEETELDLALNRDGECEGTIGVQGGTAEVRRTAEQSWMKPDETFWQTFAGPAAEQITRIVGDRWVVIPQGTLDADDFCSLDELLKDFEEDSDDGDTPLTKDGTQDLDGEEVLKLNGETDDGDPSEIYVRTEEPHYIVKMEVTEGEEPGVFEFSDFDEELEIQAPPQDEVVDLNQLGG